MEQRQRRAKEGKEGGKYRSGESRTELRETIREHVEISLPKRQSQPSGYDVNHFKFDGTRGKLSRLEMIKKDNELAMRTGNYVLANKSFGSIASVDSDLATYASLVYTISIYRKHSLCVRAIDPISNSIFTISHFFSSFFNFCMARRHPL